MDTWPNRVILVKLFNPRMAKTVFEAFSEEFFRELKQARSNPAAYDAATAAFEKRYNGLQAFPSHDSFRKKLKRNIENKKAKR